MRGWTRLRHLQLSGVLISDELLIAIAEQFPNLQSLEIEAYTAGEMPSVTPAGIASLDSLSSLTRLAFVECGLTGAHLKKFAALKQLRQVSLRNNGDLDDEDIRPLQALPNLDLLDLEGTQVTPGISNPLRRAWEPRQEHVVYRGVVG